MTGYDGTPGIGNKTAARRALSIILFAAVIAPGYSTSVEAQTISAALSGLTGCSTDSFSVSSILESAAGSTVTSTGGASSAGSTQTLTLTKPFETCSTAILEALAEGKAKGALTITISAPYWTSPFIIQIPKAVINNYTLDDENPSAPLENLQVSYSEVSFEGPVATLGAPAAQVQVAWTGGSLFGAQGWIVGVQLSGKSSAGGGTAAKATYSNVVLTKYADSYSGVLFLAAHTGKSIGTVTITTPASQYSPSVKITLQNVIVTSDQIADQTNGQPLETVSLSFKSIAVAYEGGPLP